MIYSIIPTTLTMLPTCMDTSLYKIKDLLILDSTSNILGYLKPLIKIKINVNYINQHLNIIKDNSWIANSASIATFGVSLMSLGILIKKIDALDSKIINLSMEMKDIQKIVNRMSSHQKSLENAQFKTPFDQLQLTIHIKCFDTKKQILINCKQDFINQINFYNDLLSSMDFWRISDVPLQELEIAYQRYIASIFASIYVDIFLCEIDVATNSCNQYIQDTKNLEKKLDLQNIFMNRTSIYALDEQSYKIEIDKLKKIKEIQNDLQNKLILMKNETSFLKFLQEKGENIDHFYQKINKIEQNSNHEILVIKKERG